MADLESSVRVITVDGPSASGKSSVAREVARRLGWLHVNTGNMYRAATWAVLRAGVDPKDADGVLKCLADTRIENLVADHRTLVRVDGQDVEAELNSEAINHAVSLVARVPEVRHRLVAMQRQLGAMHPCVMEGRDIGTVVFPEAVCKFYVDASEEVREKRRGLQGQSDALKKRDLIDSTRKTSPLKPARDAVVIDSSDLTLAQVVNRVMEILWDREFPPRPKNVEKKSFAYWLGWTLFRFLGRSLFNYEVVGREKLNVSGGALVISNHVSFLDPPLVGIAFDEAIHYFARKTLFDHPIAGAILRSWGSIPVDQDRPDMGSVKKVIRLVQQGRKVLVFPEGSRSYDDVLLPGMPGIGLIVSKCQAPVIPVHIFGTHKALPRDGKMLHSADITVVVGDVWHYNPEKYTTTGKELYQQISDELMAEIACIQL